MTEKKSEQHKWGQPDKSYKELLKDIDPEVLRKAKEHIVEMAQKQPLYRF
ncbi:hypothetical protein MOF37_14590 [Bacillus spizizenii]|nr:hypothetical protein [Bacillus spizizenii]MCY9427663.1 hypothetical protein [Bacillus spizizenii]MCY9430577.1 hypothetical protein [Bacillus spizizenii]